MGKCRKIFDRIFIDGLSGMAQGLFATLIIGTIIQQIGTLIGGYDLRDWKSCGFIDGSWYRHWCSI